MPSNLFFLDGESRNRQRLALVASDLDPIVGAARMIARIADLRGHAFEPHTVCGLEHLSAVDLKAVTEQDVRFGDQRAKRGLPFEQWRFAHIVSV